MLGLVRKRLNRILRCSKNGSIRSFKRPGAVTMSGGHAARQICFPIGIDEDLLVDPAHALEGFDIEGTLGSISRNKEAYISYSHIVSRVTQRSAKP